jgi:hypothetical protein
MAKPQFIKIYRCVWDNEDVKKLKDSSFRFLVYILFKSYQQTGDKNKFSLKPKEIYTEFDTSHTKLWRIQNELVSLKIKVDYSHKFYSFDLTEFFQNYYPDCFKNGTVEDDSENKEIDEVYQK